MTEEHKKKLAEGRAAARLLREGKTRAADLPAGHDRDEARRMTADVLAEEVEAGPEAVDPSKLHRKDNEIQRHIERHGPNRGTIPVDNPQPGFRYMRHPTVDQFQDNSARSAVRMSIEQAKSWGYELVTGDMPEDQHFKGNDAAGPSSARGVGDTVLWRISEENYKKMQEYYATQQNRKGQVEERLAVIGSSAGIPAWGGDVSRNPELARRFGPAFAQPVTITSQFSEGDIRRGSIPGIPAPGVH